MEWQHLAQTSEHVGPGKYLGQHGYTYEPSQAPFGSRTPRFRGSEPPGASPAKEHRERAQRAVREEGQAEFEEEVTRSLHSWLSRYKLNLADTVAFSLKVQNLDFANLTADRGLALAFEEKLREAVAYGLDAYLTPDDISLELSSGSTIGWTVIVRCKVTPPRGVRAQAVASTATSEAFADAVASGLATVDGIQEVATASWPIRVGVFGPPKLEPVRFGCCTLMPGPEAPANCTECGSYHFWLCCACGVAQYEEQCASGCERGKFGWVCISSVCKDDTTVDKASVTCGCWRQARYHISK